MQTTGEAAARTRKAALLADVLVRHGATSHEIFDLPPSGRAMAAAIAGVRLPSDATWAAVVALVRHRERTKDRQPRESAVPCSRCGASTWNVEGVCDGCVTRGVRQ